MGGGAGGEEEKEEKEASASDAEITQEGQGRERRRGARNIVSLGIEFRSCPPRRAADNHGRVASLLLVSRLISCSSTWPCLKGACRALGRRGGESAATSHLFRGSRGRRPPDPRGGGGAPDEEAVARRALRSTGAIFRFLLRLDDSLSLSLALGRGSH
jgi:hypothetical protein